MRIEASALGYVTIRPLPSVLGRNLMQEVNCAAWDAPPYAVDRGTWARSTRNPLAADPSPVHH
jgi:hypothetical protein